MEKAYDEDRKRYEKGKPANLKLKYLATLKDDLKNVIIFNQFRLILGINF